MGARPPGSCALKGAAEIIWVPDVLVIGATAGCWQGLCAGVPADAGAGEGQLWGNAGAETQAGRFLPSA